MRAREKKRSPGPRVESRVESGPASGRRGPIPWIWFSGKVDELILALARLNFRLTNVSPSVSQSASERLARTPGKFTWSLHERSNDAASEGKRKERDAADDRNGRKRAMQGWRRSPDKSARCAFSELSLGDMLLLPVVTGGASMYMYVPTEEGARLVRRAFRERKLRGSTGEGARRHGVTCIN